MLEVVVDKDASAINLLTATAVAAITVTPQIVSTESNVAETPLVYWDLGHTLLIVQNGLHCQVELVGFGPRVPENHVVHHGWHFLALLTLPNIRSLFEYIPDMRVSLDRTRAVYPGVAVVGVASELLI